MKQNTVEPLAVPAAWHKPLYFGQAQFDAPCQFASQGQNFCRFFLAQKGALHIETPDACLFVPAGFGVWIPAGVQHCLMLPEPMSVLHVAMDELVWGECGDLSLSVVSLDAFASVLIEQVCTHITPEFEPNTAAARQVQVLIDVLETLPEVDFYLPFPRDARLIQVCRAIQQAPAEPHLLEGWADKLAMSSRTLARLFSAQTGLSFQTWRQEWRLLTSLAFLRRGMSVTTTALEVGYATPSAYIYAFKRKFGMPPTQFRE